PRLVVGPDHVADVAADERVVSVAAEQPVVHPLLADERVASPSWALVNLQALLRWPALLAGSCHAPASRSVARGPRAIGHFQPDVVWISPRGRVPPRAFNACFRGTAFRCS